MILLFLPELFYQISTNLNDKEKIFLTSCSKITYNLKSLIRLDLEYNLEEINDKWHAKNIIIKNFSLESKIKELIENSISGRGEKVNFKYVKFISNNTNVKLFHNEIIINKIVSYGSEETAKVVPTFGGYHYFAMKIMLNNDESIENINQQFIYASWCGYLPIVKLLIKKGADIHANNDWAIIGASSEGYLTLVKLLIKKGADIHALCDWAIICASRGGHIDIVELLINSGSNIHARNHSPIIYASQNGHSSIVKLLIESGANIFALDNEAIIYASRYGHLSMVKLLIDLGVDVHAQNNQAIIEALRNGHSSIVKLLIEAEANIRGHARR